MGNLQNYYFLLALGASSAEVASEVAFGVAASMYLRISEVLPFAMSVRSCSDQKLASSSKCLLSAAASKNSSTCMAQNQSTAGKNMADTVSLPAESPASMENDDIAAAYSSAGMPALRYEGF